MALSPLKRAKTAETQLDVVEGMEFDRGYLSPYMVTDAETMECVMDDALLLITDKKVSSIQDLLPILEQVMKSGQKLVIIAEDVEGEALSTLLLNKIRGVLNVACVKAPGYGDRRKEMLKDIAILTGGEVITGDLDMDLKDTTFDQLGKAHQVKITKDDTTIVGGAGDPAAIQARISEIKSLISDHRRPSMTRRSTTSVWQSCPAA